MAETIDHPLRFASRLAAIGLGLLIFLLAAGAARADVFTVPGVEVYAEGGNADEARQAAMDQAYGEAYQALLRRLVVDEDLTGAPPLSRAEIEPLVASFEVQSESIKKTSYTATLTFAFKPEAVRNLFAAQGLRFTEAQSRPVVVLPVLGEGDEARLWQDPNPWRLAWANHQGRNALVPLIVPLGELEDVVAADAPEALAGNERQLGELAARYGASDSLVAQALVQGDPAAGGAGLSVRVRGYGAVASQPFVIEFRQEPGESEAAFYGRAVNAVSQKLDGDWKRANAIYYGTQSNLPVTVLIGALQDWLIARQALESSPLVISVQVLSLSQSQAEIVIVHRGTVEQLRLALAQQDLILQSGPSGWELAVGTDGGAIEQRQLGTQ